MDQVLIPIESSTKFDQLSKNDLVEKYETLEEEYWRLSKDYLKLKHTHLTEAQLFSNEIVEKI